eukprot:COSAG01_NODE_50570_length_362_cov_0.787072_1_plen_65_part_01
MGRRVTSAAVVSSVHLLVHVCQAAPLTHQSSNDLATVVTTAGPVRGIVGNDYRMWRGIPFAEPPT